MNRSLKQDYIYNYISVVVLAVSGIFFNSIIVILFDASTLGVFNQVYSYYIMFSQLAVLGLNSAVLKESSISSHDIKLSSKLLYNAIITVSVIASIVSISVLFITYGLYEIFKVNIYLSVMTIAPALLFFSLNKVIISYINGMEKMKLYAIFQCLRNIFIVISIIIFYFIKINSSLIGLVFLMSELTLFLILLAYILFNKLLTVKYDKNICKQLLNFGIKIMPSNLILEFNTKIDIICLGWILQDNELIGLYSFAVLFAEGFYQILVVVRRFINPKIAQMYQKTKTEFLQEFNKLNNLIKKYSIILSLIGVVGILVGYAILCIIIDRREYISMLMPLSIILFSIAVNSRMAILGNFLSQTGHPTQESKVNFVSAGSNFVFNIILINLFNVIGAAMATGISYFVFSTAQKYYIREILNKEK